MREIPQLHKKPGTAIVLSGGATKAFYFHLGVLKVLQPENITSIVGSSAGAVVGAFIASGATVDNLLGALHQDRVYLPKFDAWVRTLTSTMLFKPKYQDIAWQSLLTGYAGLRFLASLPMLYNRDLVTEALDRLIESQSHVSGFFDAIALENLFKSLLPSTDFADAEIDLYVVATCLDCRKRGVFNGIYEFEDTENIFMFNVPIHKAVRASTCIPGMFEPVKVNGKYYVDGEIKQTLSADIGVRLADKVIVSHTYQPLYMGDGGSVKDLGWVNIVKQSATIVLSERIAIWRHIYEQQNPDKEIIWIQPDPEDVEFFTAPEFSFSPDAQRKMIRSGELAALKALNKTPSEVI
ncbi:MAG: patatin-like phospholipase family protein [Chloroflexi bacterium]|nr:patatin-like phospholipase family protein [Chloroflexota bacterium]